MKPGDEVRYLYGDEWCQGWLDSLGQRKHRVRNTRHTVGGSYTMSVPARSVRLPTPEEVAKQALEDRRTRVATRFCHLRYSDLGRTAGDDHAWLDRVEAWLDAMPRREP